MVVVRKRGRPKKPPNERRSVKLSAVRLTEAEADRLFEIARRRRIDVAVLQLRLVRSFLKSDANL